MKRWEILNDLRFKNRDLRIDKLIKIILANRGLKTKKEIEEFINPRLKNVTTKSVGIDNKQLKKAIERIQKAIENKEQIVIFGDYDVDGICGTAILWETLNNLGAKVMPYIPHRIDEGYGLSIAGISNIKYQISKINDTKLIITVDNGIVANKAVDFANIEKIDVIITDHHVPSKKLPDAFAIVHATKLCGAGVAYLLAQELKIKNKKLKIGEDKHLELVALATVADLVPLKGANRTLLKFGLEAFRKTKRVGLLELLKEAALKKESLGVYEIGHMIAPRLNAMGRLEYAMDSLRLICTNNKKRAENLAKLLGNTNRERQELTLETFESAKLKTQNSKLQLRTQSLLFLADTSYQQGIIGLVAGKLVEEFYRPSIVVSIGEKYSKASARSVRGFNIVEFIREQSSFLVDAGGHPMAAGFTVETSKLIDLQKALEDRAELVVNKDLLIPRLKIDCELPLSFVDFNLYESLQKMAPFGMGNPEPTFISRDVIINNVRAIGKENKHLKLQLICLPEASAEGSLEILRSTQNDKGIIEGIGFGMGEMSSKIHMGDKVDIVYTIDENEWNGNKCLQLKIRDLR